MSREERARSFGAYADSYERARPGYPDEAARWLAPGSPRLIVELGAGTGKLTRALAALAAPVLAVEPDDRMRAVLDSLALDGVETAAGTAEAIPAADGAADAVVAGSSFHWFDLDRALPEIARVLGEDGVLSFAWNRRDESDPAMKRIVEVIHGDPAGAPRRWAGNREWTDLVPASGLFGPVEEATFPHHIVLPRDGIGDLVRSYSRVGLLPPDEQEAIATAARAIVDGAPELHDGDNVRLPFIVHAYRAARTA